MNKLELIQALKDATDLTKPEAAAVVDIFFNEMAEELAKGGWVEIRGLCSLMSNRTMSTLDFIHNFQDTEKQKTRTNINLQI
jgi:nucleoid DNA-binding protein